MKHKHELKFIINNGYATLIGCEKNITELTIPENIVYNNKQYTVNAIGNKAFAYCTKLMQISIPSTITSIGNKAFIYCVNLKEIYIPNSITEIGNAAFAYCKSLNDINLPNSLLRIGNAAFECCTSLTSIAIPDSVTSIGTHIFANCRSLTDIKLSNRISKIPSFCFKNCTSLKTINIPPSVKIIENNAFKNCIKLTDAISPQNIENKKQSGNVQDNNKTNTPPKLTTADNIKAEKLFAPNTPAKQIFNKQIIITNNNNIIHVAIKKWISFE